MFETEKESNKFDFKAPQKKEPEFDFSGNIVEKVFSQEIESVKKFGLIVSMIMLGAFTTSLFTSDNGVSTRQSAAALAAANKIVMSNSEIFLIDSEKRIVEFLSVEENIVKLMNASDDLREGFWRTANGSLEILGNKAGTVTAGVMYAANQVSNMPRVNLDKMMFSVAGADKNTVTMKYEFFKVTPQKATAIEKLLMTTQNLQEGGLQVVKEDVDGRLSNYTFEFNKQLSAESMALVANSTGATLANKTAANGLAEKANSGNQFQLDKSIKDAEAIKNVSKSNAVSEEVKLRSVEDVAKDIPSNALSKEEIQELYKLNQQLLNSIK